MTETIPDPGPADSEEPWHIQWLRAQASRSAPPRASAPIRADRNAPLPSGPRRSGPQRVRRAVAGVITAVLAGAVLVLAIVTARSRPGSSAATTAPSIKPSSALNATSPRSTVAGGALAATSAVSTSATSVAAPTTLAPTTTVAPTTSLAPTTTASPTTTAAPPPTTIAAPPTTVPVAPAFLEGPPSELLPGGQTWPHALYIDSKLHMQGAVPSREVADAVGAKAAEILGPDNVIDEFDIDPTVPLVKTVLVRLGPIVVFEPGSAVIRPEYLSGFDLWALLLQRNPDLTLTIIGYTDVQGGSGYNLNLATRRAEAARARIIANDIDPARVDTVARGQNDPVGDNLTTNGRAQNRRIEFALTGVFG